MARRMGSVGAKHEPGEDAAAASPRVEGRAWLALAVASSASFLVLLDDSAVALALSTLGRELGLGLTGLEWVVNAYTLAFAALTLYGGMLADRLGTRRVLCGGLAAFAVVSLAAGFAGNGATLLALRAAQGASAAFVAPAALSAVTAAFPAARRGLALGVWTGVSAAALASGPVIGALLTATLGWRSIFLVNVPLGALLVAAGLMALPPGPRRLPAGRLDLAGLLTSGGALYALVLGLTEASRYGWTSARLWILLAVAFGGFAVFARIERHAVAPLMDLSLFRLPNFLVGNILGLVNLAIMCSLFIFLALYLQRGLLYSPLDAGLALLPFTGLTALAAPLGGRLADRVGARATTVAGMGVAAAGLALLGRLGSGTGFSDVAPGLLLVGLGLGLASAPITTAALASVPETSAGIGAATVSVSRLVGLTLGVSVMGAIVAIGWTGGEISSAADRDAFAGALGTGFAVSAGVAALGAVAAMAIREPPRRQPGEPRPALWPSRHPGEDEGPAD